MRGFRRRREAENVSRPELARQIRNGGEGHELGGRHFALVGDSTIEQDLIILSLIRKAGLDEVMLEEGETPQAFALRILDVAIQSGAVMELLGCLLIPEDRTAGAMEPGDAWTPEIGQETSRFIAELRDPADKAKVKALILSLLVSFFDRGIASLWSSRTS